MLLKKVISVSVLSLLPFASSFAAEEYCNLDLSPQNTCPVGDEYCHFSDLRESCNKIRYMEGEIRTNGTVPYIVFDDRYELNGYFFSTFALAVDLDTAKTAQHLNCESQMFILQDIDLIRTVDELGHYREHLKPGKLSCKKQD